MRFPILAALAFLAAAALSTPSQAAFSFGDDENLHVIQDVSIVGEKNEALSLGYKTTTKNIFLPYTIVDDGYVLVDRSDHDRYYPMTADQIAGWQKAGLLPNPLPKYEIPLIDKIIGYILWPTLVVIALLYTWQFMRRRRQGATIPATTTAVNPTPPNEPPIT